MTANPRNLVPIGLALLVAGCGFATTGHVEPPGFLLGIWHGLLAPWTLILRLFMDVQMYALPNTGWFYDFGFLLGIMFSLPVGWMAALVAIVVHVL
ncbi:MAG: hypothetical protein M9951_11320 [Burkholderiaceae bacterium]|nr:hypothetical protein [Burkholderiaceae bacterium]MEB2318191.1 hypothetical protein [Pseudomonadota bacterium]